MLPSYLTEFFEDWQQLLLLTVMSAFFLFGWLESTREFISVSNEGDIWKYFWCLELLKWYTGHLSYDEYTEKAEKLFLRFSCYSQRYERWYKFLLEMTKFLQTLFSNLVTILNFVSKLLEDAIVSCRLCLISWI